MMLPSSCCLRAAFALELVLFTDRGRSLQALAKLLQTHVDCKSWGKDSPLTAFLIRPAEN